MTKLRAILLVPLLVVLLPQGLLAKSMFYDSPRTISAAGGDFVVPGDLVLDCTLCPAYIYVPRQTTDAVGDSLVIHAGHAWGDNRVGGNLYLSPGDGAHKIVVTDHTICGTGGAGGDSDLVSIAVRTTTGSAVTDIYAGDDFSCGSSVTEAAANLQSVIAAISGLTGSTVSTDTVYFLPDETTLGISITITDRGSDGAFATDTEGAYGKIFLPDPAGTIPIIASMENPNLGIGFNSPYYVEIIHGGNIVSIGNGSIYIGGVQLTQSGVWNFSAGKLTVGPYTAADHASNSDLHVSQDLEVDGVTYLDGGAQLAGDLELQCSTCPSTVFMTGKTSDSDGDGITMHAGHAYGTSRDGGDLMLSGGEASHEISCDYTIAALDEVTTSVDGTPLPALIEGTDFNRGSSNNECAANLCAAINAQSGVSCSGSTSPIYPTPDGGTSYISFAIADGGVDGEFGSDTTGDRGKVKLPEAVDTSTSVLQFGNGAGIGTYTTNGLSFMSTDGVRVFAFTSGGLFTNGQFISSNGGPIRLQGGLLQDTTDAVELGTACTGGGIGDVCTGGGLYLENVLSYAGTGTSTLWDSDTITTSTSAVPAANAPDLDAFPSGGVTAARCYPDGSDTYLYGQWHAPPGYADGTNIIVEIHWASDGTNTGNVDWEVAYSECTPGSACASNTTVSVQDAGPGTAYDTQSVTVATITGTTLVDDSNVFFRIMRDGNDAVNDTLTDDACLIALEIYYERDAPGKFASTP